MAGETTTTVWANIVQAAYDRAVRLILETEPVHRAIADVFPEDAPMRGSSVVISRHGRLSPTVTPLTEDVDPTAVATSNPTQVTVPLNEYGAASIGTLKLAATSFSEVDQDLAKIIANHMLNSLDRLFRAEVVGGTYADYAGTATSTATVTATMFAIGKDVADAVAMLRTRGAKPRKGSLYGAIIHPQVARDLRVDTGAAAWKTPHEYSAPENIWAGELGSLHGAFFIESIRAYAANDGSASAGVFRTQFFGSEYLAEAVAIEPGVRIGPVVDKLSRFRPVGWYGILGMKRFRESCGLRFESAAELTGSGTVPSDMPID